MNAPFKGIRIPECGKFWPAESGILGFEFQNPTNDYWNIVVESST